MAQFWRILQLATLALVFFIVSGATVFLISLVDGGLLERWMGSPSSPVVGTILLNFYLKIRIYRLIAPDANG